VRVRVGRGGKVLLLLAAGLRLSRWALAALQRMRLPRQQADRSQVARVKRKPLGSGRSDGRSLFLLGVLGSERALASQVLPASPVSSAFRDAV